MANRDSVESISAALVIDQLTFDRLGPIIEHLSVGLLDSVSEVVLITPAEAALRLSLGPVRVIRHPHLRWPMRDRIVRRILEDWKPQASTVIHAVSCRSFDLAEELALEAQHPLVGHLWGSEDLRPRPARILQRMGRIVAASKPLLESARDRHLAEPERITLIRPGLLPEAAPTCFVRDDRIPTLLCMSALKQETGIESLIRAVKIVVSEKQDLMLFLVAKGSGEAKLRKLVERENLIKHVTFSQPMMNWLQAMRAADIFVVPGNVDRVDARLLHAMAAGMATVTGAMPNSDFVIDGQTALVCADPTAQSLAAAIRRLLDDRARARLLASRALEHCKKHHSLSKMAQQTAEVYRAVSGRPVASENAH